MGLEALCHCVQSGRLRASLRVQCRHASWRAVQNEGSRPMSMRVPMIGCVLLLLLSAGLAARQGSTPPPPRADLATARHPPGERVPVPDPSDKALSYYRTGTILWVVDNLWGLLVPALFLFTGWSARVRTWAARLGRRWFFTIALYFVAFSVVTFLFDLPLAFYEGYVREHAY